MTYVTSDLHGCCSVEEFQALMRRAGITEDDELYVLGDVIDRGAHGVELLQWMTEQINIQFVLGNHEAMLLACDFIFETVTEDSLAKLDHKKLGLLHNWMENGAEPTLKGLRALKRKDPELVCGILDYLRDAPLFECVEAGERRFVLVHSGLEHFCPDRPLTDYTPDELLWARPSPDTRYFSDLTVVFGHTPTEFFGAQYRGKVLKTDSWICIDPGTAAGNPPVILRLDDMKEFY